MNAGAKPQTVHWNLRLDVSDVDGKLDDLPGWSRSDEKCRRLVVLINPAPLATIAALAAIGVLLGWPLWWVSTCSCCAAGGRSVAINLAVASIFGKSCRYRRRCARAATGRCSVRRRDLGGGGDWVPALDDTDRDFNRDSLAGASCHGDDGRVILRAHRPPLLTGPRRWCPNSGRVHIHKSSADLTARCYGQAATRWRPAEAIGAVGR